LGTRFFPFRLQGKEGHVNVYTVEDFAQRLAACDLPLIAELRRAEMSLLERARQPLTEAVGTA
jgi:hypothetical protein